DYRIPQKITSHVETKNLNPGQTGAVPNEIEALLGIKGIRKTVNIGKTSFIHNLCYIFFEKYRSIFDGQAYNAETVLQLNNYVRATLNLLLDNVFPGCAKQE